MLDIVHQRRHDVLRGNWFGWRGRLRGGQRGGWHRDRIVRRRKIATGEQQEAGEGAGRCAKLTQDSVHPHHGHTSMTSSRPPIAGDRHAATAYQVKPTVALIMRGG
ncbi:MAG: hypothetical protein ABIP44_12480 [Pseudoxanthomonas sp.]